MTCWSGSATRTVPSRRPRWRREMPQDPGIMQRGAQRAFGRTRRAGFLLGLLALVVAPVPLIPAVAGQLADEQPWPFRVVPRAAWLGDAPTPEEAGNVVPVEFQLGGYRGLDVLGA